MQELELKKLLTLKYSLFIPKILISSLGIKPSILLTMIIEEMNQKLKHGNDRPDSIKVNKNDIYSKTALDENDLRLAYDVLIGSGVLSNNAIVRNELNFEINHTHLSKLLNGFDYQDTLIDLNTPYGYINYPLPLAQKHGVNEAIFLGYLSGEMQFQRIGGEPDNGFLYVPSDEVESITTFSVDQQKTIALRLESYGIVKIRQNEKNENIYFLKI